MKKLFGEVIGLLWALDVVGLYFALNLYGHQI